LLPALTGSGSPHGAVAVFRQIRSRRPTQIRLARFPIQRRPIAAHRRPCRLDLPGIFPMSKFVFVAAALAALGASPALAHVTLETQQAAIGSTYKAVLRVPHGCKGAATIKVRVQVPEGVIAIKPMPKPGWTLETVKGKYEKAYDYYGTPTGEGVREVVWSGGKLLDEHYDEFVLRGYLTSDLKPETTLYVPVVQECEGGGVERWIEIPAAGRSADETKYPAPGLKLGPKK
jgi:uncharacterized protein YcnI